MSYILVGLSTKKVSLFGFLIRLFGRWKHSHVVLIHSNGKELIEAAGGIGVRVMPISYLMKRDEVEIRRIRHPFPDAVWMHAMTQRGKPYDEKYSWGWLLRRDWQDENQWACTELIEWACRLAGHGIFPQNIGYITPRDFYLVSEEIEK